jgi:hypothetical protein
MLTRRALLGGSVATAGAIVAAPAASGAVAIPEIQENSDLIEAWKQFRWAENDYRDASDPEAKALADKVLNSKLRDLITQKAGTMYGVRLKADAIASACESMGISLKDAGRTGIIGYSFWLSCDVLEHTDNLNGKWKEYV